MVGSSVTSSYISIEYKKHGRGAMGDGKRVQKACAIAYVIDVGLIPIMFILKTEKITI